MNYKYSDLESIPATSTMAAIAVLPIDMDLSYNGVLWAVALSKDGSGIAPTTLLVDPGDRFLAKEIMNLKYGLAPLAHFDVRYDFFHGQWCVGSFEAAEYFVGSVGA